MIKRRTSSSPSRMPETNRQKESASLAQAARHAFTSRGIKVKGIDCRENIGKFCQFSVSFFESVDQVGVK
ncbi:hypothetical protein ACVWW6_002836 [Bradyrhizobium sp. USDA 3311]|uniref:hypothetical protein n=1 Tax=unclassified Bradyrhizobium TaxID=2631580 RepID=UPI001373B12E|nr:MULTISPECIES: hypothetical protein [unclassified Bradyrhizobium]QHP73593.1 hypothetical protein EI171_43955 [Bradyrhizobium sp. LCT2]